jgi:hypothetical protein
MNVLFALLPLQTNTTSCMMIMTVRRCPNVNLHTIAFPLNHRPTHIARLGGDYCVKERTSCNCAEGHCYHPWSSNTPNFNPLDSKANIAKHISGIRKVDTSEGINLFPSREPPLIPEYYAACHSPETMPNVVDTDNPIQGMLSNAAMMSSKKKAKKLSAYEADPITVG